MSSPKTTAGAGSRRGWSVFDHVKSFSPTPSPDVLIADIDAAIAASELSHSSSLLSNLQFNRHHHQQHQEKDDDEGGNDPRKDRNNVGAAVGISAYDARLADESYKDACAALSSGRLEAAVRSLRIAIASCPPDKATAIAKLRSLMAIAESQLKQKQQQ